jgi:hypothetical protein
MLKSFEFNPKPDQRLEEYERMLGKYDKFRVDVDGSQAGFPNRGVPLDKPLYNEYREHPRLGKFMLPRRRFSRPRKTPRESGDMDADGLLTRVV